MEEDNLIIARRTSAELAAADLDHAAWEGARPVQLTRYWSGEEAPRSRHAEARILWSEAALYVRFICRQDEPLVIAATLQTEGKTLGLWERDVCEIFIAPGGESPQRYLEFEAAPTGEWLDLAIRYVAGVRATDWDFRSGMGAAARIDEGRVLIALRVPWTAFGRAPQPTERWRVNLFRCVGQGPERGYLAWQPTRTPQPDFHVPLAFGQLEFQE
jgi:alpha-galactosidase